MLACQISQSAFPVAGRIKHFHINWSLVTQDQWVLDTIQGYGIEFTENPVQTVCPRVSIASAHKQSLVQEEIHSLLQKGTIVEISHAEATTGFVGAYFERIE